MVRFTVWGQVGQGKTETDMSCRKCRNDSWRSVLEFVDILVTLLGDPLIPESGYRNTG
jgi:hypothetical protein